MNTFELLSLEPVHMMKPDGLKRLPSITVRTKDGKPHMNNWATDAYTPEIEEEKHRLRERSSRRRRFISLDEASAVSNEHRATRPVYPKIPDGMTLSEVLMALVFHKPEMAIEAYTRAVANDHAGVLMTLPGIVRDLIERGFYSVHGAKERGDYQRFKFAAKTCPSAKMIFAALQSGPH